MQAKARYLGSENVKGENAKGKYDFDLGEFLDLEGFDKVKLMLSKEQVISLAPNVNKDGSLVVSVNAKTDKLLYKSFRLAA